MTTNEVLTPYEVADILKVSYETVMRYIREGKIRAVRISPKCVRILRRDLDFLFNVKEVKKDGSR